MENSDEYFLTNSSDSSSEEGISLSISEQEREKLFVAVHILDEIPLLDFLKKYLLFERGGRGLGRKSWDSYRLALETLLRFLRVRKLVLFDFVSEAPYAAWLKGLGYSDGTIRTRISLSRKVYQALNWAGVLQHLPKKVGFNHVHSGKTGRQPFSHAEVKHLLARADIEEKLIVSLGIDLGLRASEMLRLTRDQFDLTADPPYLLLPDARSAPQKIDFSKELAEMLGIWIASTPHIKSTLFSGRHPSYLEDRMRQLCQRAGVSYEARGVQGLRLTAGARVFQDKQSLSKVRAFLRTVDKTSSAAYAEAAALLNPSKNVDAEEDRGDCEQS